MRREVHEIKWNAHMAGIFDMPADVMEDYYRAYRAFMALTRDAAFHLRLKLRAGEMVVFDNRRVLHGRDAFDPSTGHGGIFRAVTWTGARCCRASGSCRADSWPRGGKQVLSRQFFIDKLPPYPGARSAHPAKMRSRNTTT
jgi:hypothetical protein